MKGFVDGQWQDVPSPTTERLLDVVMLNRQEGWAVGQGGALLHYIDDRWEQVSIPNFYSNLEDIEMVSDTDCVTGIYTVWLHGYAPNAAGDSLYVALDDQPAHTLTGFRPGAWSWANRSTSLRKS